MKRPFLYSGILSLAISIALTYYDFPAWLLIVLIPLVVLLYIKKKSIFKNTNIIVLTVSVFLVLASAIFMRCHIYEPISRLDETTETITATVTREPLVSEDYATYTLSGRHPSISQKFNFMFTSKNIGLNMGDQVNLTVEFEELDSKYHSSNLSRGIYIETSPKKINSIKKRGSIFYSSLYNVRYYIKNVLCNNARGETGALLTALVSGDRSLMSDSLYSAAKSCGITHILVVSGLHLGILCGAFSRLFKKLKIKSKICVFIVFSLICLIVCICEFHTSAIRSAITVILTLIAGLISRRADSLNSLGFAVTVMTFSNPFIVGDVAFLLSIFSTFGVIYVAPKLIELSYPIRFKSRFHKPLNAALDITIISISALLSVSPILIYYYGYISLLSPIISIFINSAVTLSLITSVFGIIISLLPFINFLSAPILFISRLLSAYIIEILLFFSKFARSFTLIIGREYTIPVFLLTGIVIVIITIFYNKKIKGDEENAN